MNKLSRFNITNEAIAFQDGKLFSEIVKVFDSIKKEGYKEDKDQLSKLGIDALVFKHTGLLIKTEVDPDGDFEIYIPTITKNSMLIPNSEKKHIKNNLGIKYIQQQRADLLGTVDLKNCKVGGVFSKILGTVRIDPAYIFGIGVYDTVTSTTYTSNGPIYTETEIEKTAMYNGGWQYKSEELAAVFLHEVGHLFTAFEYLVETVTTNLVIDTVCNELLESNDQETKMVILSNIEKSLGLSIPDKEALSKSENKNTIYNVLLSSNIIKNRSSTDTSVYDHKSWEFLADQFAVRHGAGRYIVEALYSFDKSFGELKRTKATVIGAAISTVIINMLLIPIGVGVITSLMCLFWDFGVDTKPHDDNIQRFTRIKTDMTQRLKNPKLSKELKNSIITDIERINYILSTMEDHRSVMAVFWDYVRPARRDARNQYVFQEKLEKIAGNSMFVNAAKLSTLS